MKLLPVFAIIALVLGLAGCASTQLPPDIETMDASVIIQRAQERADKNDWKGAEQLYAYCQNKFTDDSYIVTVCRYEIAFCAYKIGQYDRARNLITALIADYEKGAGVGMPPHILKLAKLLVETLDKKTGKAK